MPEQSSISGNRLFFEKVFAFLKGAWEWVALIGTQEVADDREIARMKIYNQMNLVVCLIMVPIMILDITRGYLPGFLIALTIFTTTAGGFYFIHKGKFRLIIWLSIVFITLAILVLVMYFGRKVGGELIFITIGLSSVIFFREWKSRITLLVYVYVAYAVSEVYLMYYEPLTPDAEIIPVYLIVFFCTLIVTTSLVTYFIREGDLAEKKAKFLMAELKTQNEELMKANHDLSQFAYASSHHFKSPLKNISNLLGLMERKLPEDTPSQFFKSLNLVKADARHLYRLVEDILTYSTLESVEEEELEKIKVRKVIDRVLKNLEEELGQKQARVNIEPLPDLFAKESHIELMIQILIQNGLKYNFSSEPIVSISGIEEQDGAAWLLISDNGIGIEEQFLEKIFEPFQRLHDQEEFAGTGIGLTVCKRIMKSYQGDIIVSSRPGVGSVFQLYFPIPQEYEATNFTISTE